MELDSRTLAERSPERKTIGTVSFHYELELRSALKDGNCPPLHFPMIYEVYYKQFPSQTPPLGTITPKLLVHIHQVVKDAKREKQGKKVGAEGWALY